MIKKLVDYAKGLSKMYLVFNLGVLLGLVIGSSVGTLTALAVVGIPQPDALEGAWSEAIGHVSGDGGSVPSEEERN